jgi:hypothetical protein
MAANDMHRPARAAARSQAHPVAPGPAFGLWIGVAIGLYGSSFVDARMPFVAAAATIGALAGLAADPRLSSRDRWIGAAGALAIAAFFSIHCLVTR